MIAQAKATLPPSASCLGNWKMEWLQLPNGAVRSCTGGLSALTIGDNNVKIYFRNRYGRIDELYYVPSVDQWREVELGWGLGGTPVSAATMVDSKGSFSGMSIIYQASSSFHEIQYTTAKDDWFDGKISLFQVDCFPFLFSRSLQHFRFLWSTVLRERLIIPWLSSPRG